MWTTPVNERALLFSLFCLISVHTTHLSARTEHYTISSPTAPSSQLPLVFSLTQYNYQPVFGPSIDGYLPKSPPIDQATHDALTAACNQASEAYYTEYGDSIGNVGNSRQLEMCTDLVIKAMKGGPRVFVLSHADLDSLASPSADDMSNRIQKLLEQDPDPESSFSQSLAQARIFPRGSYVAVSRTPSEAELATILTRIPETCRPTHPSQQAALEFQKVIQAVCSSHQVPEPSCTIVEWVNQADSGESAGTNAIPEDTRGQGLSRNYVNHARLMEGRMVQGYTGSVVLPKCETSVVFPEESSGVTSHHGGEMCTSEDEADDERSGSDTAVDRLTASMTKHRLGRERSSGYLLPAQRW
jgi:hypothetical protein